MSFFDFRRDIAVVQIFYAEKHFRRQYRDELIGFTEFLSNIGGLLGLFMGFSFVSIVEIVYFFSLRPFFRSPNKIPSRRMSNTISKLVKVSVKQKWPVNWIRNFNEHRASGPMFRKPNYNRPRKRNPVSRINQRYTIDMHNNPSDVIFPYYE